MGFFEDEIQEFTDGFVEDIVDALIGLGTDLLEPVMRLMLGTPAPRSSNWVFGQPTNAPWNVWVPDVYYAYMVPLAFGLLLVGSAYVGLVSPALSGYARVKVLRRIGYAFLALFVWIYIATAALQFFDGIAVGIAPTAQEMVNTYTNVTRTIGGGLLMTIVAITIENIFLVLAAVVYAARYVLIYTLTLGMPVLFVFWALEAGPMKRFSGLAGALMGLYPGLLIATLPSAIMFRIAYETSLDFSIGGIAGFFVSVMFIPTASALTVYLILNSNKYVGKASSRGAKITAPAGSYAGERTARSARDIHRGMTGQAPAYNGRSYTVASNAYSAASNAGSTVRSTVNRVTRW